jgi:hypothetical protein
MYSQPCAPVACASADSTNPVIENIQESNYVCPEPIQTFLAIIPYTRQSSNYLQSICIATGIIPRVDRISNLWTPTLYTNTSSFYVAFERPLILYLYGSWNHYFLDCGRRTTFIIYGIRYSNLALSNDLHGVFCMHLAFFLSEGTTWKPWPNFIFIQLHKHMPVPLTGCYDDGDQTPRPALTPSTRGVHWDER